MDSILKCSRGKTNSRREEKFRVTDVMSFFSCWFYRQFWNFQNCPPFFSVQRLTSPVPHANVLHVFLNRPHHINLCFPKYRVPSELSTVSFLQGSSSCILNRCPNHLTLPIFITLTVRFIVEGIKLVTVSRSPHTIIGNWTYMILNILLSKIRNTFPSTIHFHV